MVLRFKNKTNEKVWVAISFYRIQCLLDHPMNQNPWKTRGWYHLLPTQTKTVYGGDLEDVNRYWYFFAESATLIWDGPYLTRVFREAFNICDAAAKVGTTRIVGFIELDIDDRDDRKVNLLPPA
jgi:uncharacterized membrane protein